MADGVGPLVPWQSELDSWLRDCLPHLQPQPWYVPTDSARLTLVPVPALRWTHDGIDKRMIFAHGERQGRSVYETTSELWRGDALARPPVYGHGWLEI